MEIPLWTLCSSSRYRAYFVCIVLGAAGQPAFYVVMAGYASVLPVYSLSDHDLAQPITSIAVHPRVPFFVCTTSADQTARIYDLDRHPDGEGTSANPFWIPGTGPSKGGAPHGLRPSEKTEWGKGQCTTVLVGGRSGGHFAAVTCAAFHPTFPLIATGGVGSRWSSSSELRCKCAAAFADGSGGQNLARTRV